VRVMSACLLDADREHVVLERGQVAQAWRERWTPLAAVFGGPVPALELTGRESVLRSDMPSSGRIRWTLVVRAPGGVVWEAAWNESM